jgi:23S rRNA (adenine-N6)-dimethyltransferase
VVAPGAPRPRGTRADGQHFLRSARLAAELVEQAGVAADDLVLEIGAGTGRLTAPLADRARRVIAVELDPVCVAHLRDSLAGRANVEVVHANALAVALPVPAFRAFGNLPFSAGTRILRRLLDDPGSSLMGLDAILQFEAARKRAAIWPSTLVSLGWLPWWDLTLVRRIPRRAFAPMPGVDAGVLQVRRRDAPLLPSERRPAFIRFLAGGFAAPGRPVAVACRAAIPPSHLRRICEERGLPREARPGELDVFDWVALFGARRR